LSINRHTFRTSHPKLKAPRSHNVPGIKLSKKKEPGKKCALQSVERNAISANEV